MDDRLLPDIKLRFNIEHPTFEECYAYGYESALADVEETDNPFITGTKESEQWLEGWWAGFYGEIPMYELNQPVPHGINQKKEAANDLDFHEKTEGFFTKMLEITGAIAVSSFLCYQIIDLVA
jgi:hypothetical protein